MSTYTYIRVNYTCCGKTWQIHRSLYLFHITLVALRQSCRRRRMEEWLPRGLHFSRSLPCLNISKRKPWKENYIQLHGRTLHWNQSHWAEFIFESLTRQVRTAFYFRSLQGRNSSRVICYDLLVCALSPCFASPESSCWGSPGSAWLFPRFEDRRCTQGTTARYGKHSNTVADRCRSQQPWLCHGMRGRADIERKAGKPLGHRGFILRHRRRDAISYDESVMNSLILVPFNVRKCSLIWTWWLMLIFTLFPVWFCLLVYGCFPFFSNIYSSVCSLLSLRSLCCAGEKPGRSV